MRIEMSNATAQKEVVVVNQPVNITTGAITVTEKKRRIGVTKSAVIGAGVGAVNGAIISKKKAKVR
jgi:hypothetical protein